MFGWPVVVLASNSITIYIKSIMHTVSVRHLKIVLKKRERERELIYIFFILFLILHSLTVPIIQK